MQRKQVPVWTATQPVAAAPLNQPIIGEEPIAEEFVEEEFVAEEAITIAETAVFSEAQVTEIDAIEESPVSQTNGNLMSANPSSPMQIYLLPQTCKLHCHALGGSKAIVQQKMLERQFEATMKEEQNNGKQHVKESETNETFLTPFISVR